MASNKSVIQSTMMKITVLIFGILLILYFFLARIYWDKEVLTRELELLKVASVMEMKVESKYQSVLGIKDNKYFDNLEKFEQINYLFEDFLAKLSQENKNIMIGYYDRDVYMEQCPILLLKTVI
ncbi:MAG: hypothetical protein ACOX3R_13335 [Desulfitobacteriia bacterium]